MKEFFIITVLLMLLCMMPSKSVADTVVQDKQKQCTFLQIEIENTMNDLERYDSYKSLMRAIWRQEHAQNLLMLYIAIGCNPLKIDVIHDGR